MSEPAYLTSDGVPFRLGMTLYRYFLDEPDIHVYQTSETGHYLDVFDYNGGTIVYVCRIGSKCGICIMDYASTSRGAVANRVGILRWEIRQREQEILELEQLADETDGAAP